MEDKSVYELLADMDKSIAEIKSIQNVISTESGFISGFLKPIVKHVNLVNNIFKGVIKKLGKGVMGTISFNDKRKINAIQTRKVLHDKKYREVMNRKTPVPVGMQVGLLTTFDLIEKDFDLVRDSMEGWLDDHILFLANFLSSKNEQKTFNVKKVTSMDMSVIKIIRKDMGTIIDPNKYNDRMLVKDLIPNLDYVNKAVKISNDLNDKINKDYLDKINKKIDILTNKIDSFIAFLTENNNKVVISKVAMNNFTKSVSDVADGVSTIMALYSLTIQLSGTVSNLIIIIKED